MLAEQDRTAKSEQILNFDKEIKNLRQEMAVSIKRWFDYVNVTIL